MKTIHIQGGILVDPQHLTETLLDIWIKNGKIIALGQAPQGLVADTMIDAKGKIIAPGIIDLSARLHLLNGKHQSILQSELSAAVAGGVTHLFSLPDTLPVLDEPGLVDMLNFRLSQQNSARVSPLGALTIGLQGKRITQMKALAEAGCIGFSQANCSIADTQVLLRAFEYASTFGYPLVLRAQDYYLSKDGVMASGALATRLGLSGVPVAAETIALKTYFELAKQTQARVHISNVSSAAAVHEIRLAKEQGLSITADVGIHHLHLLNHDIGYFNTQYRFNPPLRTDRDRAGLRKGLKEGVLDAICSDHTPVSEDDKRLPFAQATPGASTLELFLSLAVKFAQEESLSLAQLWRWLSFNSAQAFKLNSGQLALGATADLCIVNAEEFWEVDPSNWFSQGHNTPFAGYELPAKVCYTIVNGEVVFDALKS